MMRESFVAVWVDLVSDFDFYTGRDVADERLLDLVAASSRAPTRFILAFIAATRQVAAIAAERR